MLSETSEAQTPKTHTYIQPVNSMDLDDACSLFANPGPGSDRVVTLIKPPIIFSRNTYSAPLTMPLGLAYLAAVLLKAGYKVKMLDCPGLDVDNIQLTADGRFKVQGIDEDESIERIDSRTDIIGITIMFSQEWPHCRDYINKIRRAFPHAKIIVGGEHPTAMPEYTLRDCSAIDYLVTGEGELTLLELVHGLRAGKNTDGISGIAYRKRGQYCYNRLSPRLSDIKKMPWPAWDLIDVEVYFRPNFTMGIGHGRNMAMLATRGCPYQCTFCSNPSMWTTRYVMRPVKDVVDEIEYNIAKFGANNIDFYDLTAIVKRDWILDFIAELRRRNVRITWQLPSGTRCESLDEEVIQGLAQTGCEFLVYAPESASARTLAMIKKKIDLKNLEKSVAYAIRHGRVVKINFIIGFPFETRKDIFQSLLFAWKLAVMRADDCNISTFSPYPGSELFDQMRDEGVFGEINDAYFEGLMTQFDFTIAKTFCRHVGSLEIMLYRLAGMSLFYVLNYLCAPGRLVRLVRCLFRKGPFQPRSLFEQRVYDFVVRTRQGADSRKQPAAAGHGTVCGVPK
ncbi:MAG: radical SAM protein [Candidatus Omnitrophica bacterium]|nr:radical SAM protein [Candidatus Omnitrophota bacterium]